jgi:hypothetical protein
MVSAVVDGRSVQAIVEEEFTRWELEQAAGERLRDVSDSFFDGDARRLEQVFNVRGDADAKVFDELESFGEDAFDQGFIEQFEFRSHRMCPQGLKPDNPYALTRR